MISVSQAKEFVGKYTMVLDTIVLDLYEATGLILAEDIIADLDSPPFNQAAVDGYAYRFDESMANKSLTISGEIPAGISLNHTPQKNTAVRIFTGAQVPSEFDTVVMQENTKVENNQLFINDTNAKAGMNIRLKGSQITQGNLAVKSGIKLSPAVVGYIAGLGFGQVKVIKPVRVSIISTGNELITPGKTLEDGKIYESNTYSLNSALHEFGIKPMAIHKVKDDQKSIEDAVNKSLIESDMIILSGGVSVGDYDFVARALDACGVNCIFHKVKQKPGKPLYFGTKNKTLVFGLPGNPAALLTCFYEYIVPTLKKMMGETFNSSPNLKLNLTNAYVKKPGLTHFLKGKMNGNEVTILTAQESYIMSSFAVADCLVQLDESKSTFEKGELVEVITLNQKL
jgi:molybdopterin molybdotransferase